ncbi:hypothetical protein V6N13_114646 [Hibiscus sabdariffa]|uniref:Uncharacterized protein n=1 Tax=Hibiscus sabdariffa TaxID=183260 RepID=A0ABR1ZMH7_9ROSI
MYLMFLELMQLFLQRCKVLLQMLVSPLWVKLLLKQCHATEAETSSFEKAILPALVDVSVEEASSHMAQERIDMS